MPTTRRSPLRALAATVHRTVGWCLFRIGAHERARARFEQVLELRGDDFWAYVHLALVAYKLGEYGCWQRECAQARRTDPARYARLKHPFELFDPGAASPGGAARTMPPSLLPYRPVRRGLPTGPERDADAGLAPRAEPAARSLSEPPRAPDEVRGSPDLARSRPGGDDFSSDVERARFAGLAPIDAAAIAATDLDELQRQLQF
jgi:hypothetical protein